MKIYNSPPTIYPVPLPANPSTFPTAPETILATSPTSLLTTKMEALPMTKAQCLATYLQPNGSPYDKLVIGAIVLKPLPNIKELQILLLKRAPHEPIYPNIWEIPGGKVEDTDPTIQAAIEREVLEETNLKVEMVMGTVDSFDYALEKKVAGGGGGEGMMSVWSTSLQMNFICAVSNYDDLAVNPEEHSKGRFVDAEMAMEMEITEQMRAVVGEAFKWCSEHFVELTGVGE
ncbi:MAG: hypothetical protein L6R39_000421 [Caloplaca ligustica]|nr:MAG: hypothetical protein L6R39_000421 [Caloplaca ligustica]